MQGDKDVLSNLCHLANTVNADLQRGIEVYKSVFQM